MTRSLPDEAVASGRALVYGKRCDRIVTVDQLVAGFSELLSDREGDGPTYSGDNGWAHGYAGRGVRLYLQLADGSADYHNVSEIRISPRRNATFWPGYRIAKVLFTKPLMTPGTCLSGLGNGTLGMPGEGAFLVQRQDDMGEAVALEALSHTNSGVSTWSPKEPEGFEPRTGTPVFATTSEGGVAYAGPMFFSGTQRFNREACASPEAIASASDEAPPVDAEGRPTGERALANPYAFHRATSRIDSGPPDLPLMHSLSRLEARNQGAEFNVDVALWDEQSERELDVAAAFNERSRINGTGGNAHRKTVCSFELTDEAWMALKAHPKVATLFPFSVEFDMFRVFGRWSLRDTNLVLYFGRQGLPNYRERDNAVVGYLPRVVDGVPSAAALTTFDSLVSQESVGDFLAQPAQIASLHAHVLARDDLKESVIVPELVPATISLRMDRERNASFVMRLGEPPANGANNASTPRGLTLVATGEIGQGSAKGEGGTYDGCVFVVRPK